MYIYTHSVAAVFVSLFVGYIDEIEQAEHVVVELVAAVGVDVVAGAIDYLLHHYLFIHSFIIFLYRDDSTTTTTTTKDTHNCKSY